ncbi:lysophospholipid acyltransferase family protein [Phytoactinopolyspora halophila]|uniref:lysophospholipid acyltransferase family protein n=1 Tax=Phytoactinopolyspora halophila TaxID=1981511 RepID=UPI001478F5FA|nr:lysophospholipid acyltransferase family protein [Phytoactinopolyspora halophila]
MGGPKQRLGIAYRLVVFVLRPILQVITRRHWVGADRVPPEGTGVVIVANHISHLDPITFAHFLWDNGRATRYLAKDTLFRIPVIGKIIKSCGQIPVYRETHDAARAYRDAVKAVREGECVVIYPEGTITRDPQLWPMTGKTGAARVALETGCQVLPVAQWGVQTILPPYSKRPRLWPRKAVHVRVGAPVDLGDLLGRPVTTESMRQATDRIMAAVTAELEIIRGETAPELRFDPRRAGTSSTGKPSAAGSAAGNDRDDGARVDDEGAGEDGDPGPESEVQ